MSTTLLIKGIPPHMRTGNLMSVLSYRSGSGISDYRTCCYVTKWVAITSAHMGQGPVQVVPACPVQIRAHHHIDDYTDIN